MLVVPRDPYRPVEITGGLVDQLNAYKGAYGACVASLESIAEWKRSLEPPLPPERPELAQTGGDGDG
jgi:hypothetical protein